MKAFLTAAVVLILPLGIARAQTMGNPPSPMDSPNTATGLNGTTGMGPTTSTSTDTVPVPTVDPSINPYGTLGSPTQIGSERTDDPATYGMSKERVINKLHHVNQMEIQMGTMAQKNSHNSKVRSYGATLVKDHTKADKLVTAFAKDNQITFTEPGNEETNTNTTRSEEHAAKMQAKKEKMDRLTNLQGNAFDKEFLTTMAEDHQHVINILEATKGRDADKKLDQLIDKLLPTLRDHQRTAERLSEKIPSSS